MTNQELRKLAEAWQMSTGDEPNITTADCIIRLLKEHARMKAALEFYADGEHSEDHARAVLNSLSKEQP